MSNKLKRLFTISISVLMLSICLTSSAYAAKSYTATVSKLKASTYSTKVSLSWKKAKSAKKYKIYEKKNGKWKVKATTKSTSYTLKKLSPGTKHTYAIRAYNKSGKPSKKRKSVTIITKPYAVKKINTSVSADTVTLSWQKSKGATGYNIYIFDDATDKWVKLISSSVETVTIDKLHPGTKYIFGVEAYSKKSGITVCSKAITKEEIITAPEDPSNVNFTQKSNTEVSLKWNNAAGANGYRVYVYDTSKKIWQTIIECTPDTTVTIDNLKENTTYTFAVKSLKVIDTIIVKGKGQAESKYYNKKIPLKATSLILNSYAYGNGVIYIVVDSSNWKGAFSDNIQNIYVTVDGKKSSKPVPCKVSATSYEIKIDVSSLSLESGSVVDFTIPAGVVKNQSETQTNISFSASVCV